MFERFLSELLVKRFGRFIDGLDETNLKLACWQGEVLLEVPKINIATGRPPAPSDDVFCARARVCVHLKNKKGS